MGLYADRILPHVVHKSIAAGDLDSLPPRVLAAASGRVLEIGVGSGVTLPLYSNVPCRELWPSLPGRRHGPDRIASRLNAPSDDSLRFLRHGRPAAWQKMQPPVVDGLWKLVPARNECNIDDGDVESCVFDGGHDWSDTFYQTAGRLLAELQSGP